MGGALGLLALGVIVVFRSTNVLNFAQGDASMLCGFLLYVLLTHVHLPYALAVLLAVLLGGALGLVMDRLILRPLRGQPLMSSVIATLAISMILSGVALFVWGPYEFAVPSPVGTGGVRVGSISLGYSSLLALGVVAVVILLLTLLMQRTRIGLAMRATSQSARVAGLLGINVESVFSLSWVLSGALGALAAAIITPIYYLDIGIMDQLLLIAFAGVVLGGLTSFLGAVAGTVLLSVVTNVLDLYVSTQWTSPILVLIILLTLVLWPQGLFGRRSLISATHGLFARPQGGSPLQRFLGSGRRKTSATSLLVIIGVVLPFLVGSIRTDQLTQVWIAAIAILGLTVLFGFTGQVSLAQAGFMGLGAYCSAIVTTDLGFPFLGGLVAAAVVAGLFGLALGVPCLRLSGPYLAVATWGFGWGLPTAIANLNRLTGGFNGMAGPEPSLFGLMLTGGRAKYWLALVVLAVCIAAVANLRRSRIGRAWLALRSSEPAAKAMGVNITVYKLLAFVVSAMLAGVAGSLYTHTVNFISPQTFTFWNSIFYLAAVVVGGMESLPGAIVGALFLVMIPQLVAGVGNWQYVIYGGALLVVIRFAPRGIVGVPDQLANLFIRTGRRQQLTTAEPLGDPAKSS